MAKGKLIDRLKAIPGSKLGQAIAKVAASPVGKVVDNTLTMGIVGSFFSQEGEAHPPGTISPKQWAKSIAWVGLLFYLVYTGAIDKALELFEQGV